MPRRLIAEAIDIIVFIAGRGLAPPRRDASRASPASIPTAATRSPTSSPQPNPKENDHDACPALPSIAIRRCSALRHRPALAIAAPAQAAGSGMPWEQPLQQVLDSVQGPVAKIVAVIIIIVTGLTLAFGETAGGFRRLIQIVFGLSIAFAASSFFLSFFSFGGGALIA